MLLCLAIVVFVFYHQSQHTHTFGLIKFLFPPYRYTYTLGKETWVEHWPSSAECSAAAQNQCTELETFTAELQDAGCQT